MKILKIFGVVVGIHVFALIMIFANPGCSSNTKPPPSPSETVAAAPAPASPKITVPSNAAAATETSPFTPAPVSPVEASPVIAAPGSQNSSPTVTLRFSPTRPGTPAAGALDSEPVADVVPATSYTVVRGDSLWTIAKHHHLTVSELAAANGLKAGAPVQIGQKILIPAKAVPGAGPAAPAAKPAAPAVSTATRAPGDSVRHTVKPNETLGAIARKYGVKVGDIATANNITDPARIRPGMELVIPGWQAPAAKAPSRAAPAPAAPAPNQDLDAGLKPAGSTPVIQIEDPFAPRKP